jgi:hypothetical protein
MKATTIAASLLTSTLTLAVPAMSTADFRVGVGIHVGSDAWYGRQYRDTFRHGYDRGFQEGLREGEKDARKRQRFSYWDEGRYRDADRGYKGWMGPRREYASGYQRGFEEGYRRAYRRYDHRYDGRWERGERYYRDDYAVPRR